MHGPNKFKLGVFSMNSDGGLTLTKVPERWPALWSEIVEVRSSPTVRGSNSCCRSRAGRALAAR